MSDHAIAEAPRRLAIVAMIAHVLAFAATLGWHMSLGAVAPGIAEFYSHAINVMPVLGSEFGSLALILALVYGTVQGKTEVVNPQQAPCPTPLQFFGVCFVAFLVLNLLSSALIPWLFVLVNNGFGQERMAMARMSYGFILLAVNVLELIVATLLACTAAFQLARSRRRAWSGEVSGAPAAPQARPLAAPDMGTAAALVCGMVVYGIQMKAAGSLWYVAATASSNILVWAGLALAFVLLPVIPAWITYAGAKKILARRVDRTRPLRATAAGICTLLAALVVIFACYVGLTLTTYGYGLGLSQAGTLKLIAAMLALYFVALFAFGKGFSRLFYASVLQPRAAAPGQAPYSG